MPDRTCIGPDCTRPSRALGLCDPHYRQQRRGKPLTAPKPHRGQTASAVYLSRPDGTVSASLTIPEGSSINMAQLAHACRELADALDGAA